MATSTFSKQFAVNQEKATEFVNAMSQAVTPTLHQSFHTNAVHLSQEEELRQRLLRALNK